jgi:hypothetical protein
MKNPNSQRAIKARHLRAAESAEVAAAATVTMPMAMVVRQVAMGMPLPPHQVNQIFILLFFFSIKSLPSSS